MKQYIAPQIELIEIDLELPIMGDPSGVVPIYFDDDFESVEQQ